MNVATLRTWVAGRYYPTRGNPRTRFEPLILLPAQEEKDRFLNFWNLAEVHVLNNLRRVHKVNMDAVRRALGYMRKTWGDEHPLLNQQMRTDGIDLFLERYDALENVSQEGQLAIREVMKASLKRLDFDPHAGAMRFYPFTRSTKSGDDPKIVVIDPPHFLRKASDFRYRRSDERRR